MTQQLDHRKCNVRLTLNDSAKGPLANAPVEIRMVRHQFLFGCNAFVLGRFPGQPDIDYRRRFTDLLNFATLPFYWGLYEPQPGRLDEHRIRQMADWCVRQGITVKGHPLVWHEIPADWLEGRPLEEVASLQWARLRREMAAFQDLIATWDVVNETGAMPNYPAQKAITRLCAQMGRVEFIKTAFEQARRMDANATLILNDYDTSPHFEQIIEECLDIGVPIDAIGIQSHMHKGYCGKETTLNLIERFGRFRLPLHFTELTIVSGNLKTDNDWHSVREGWDSTPEGELLQEQQAVEFYRTLFADRRTQAITWWDFSDAGAWQGAPAGLLRKDMSPKPAYDALKRLIKQEWWTPPQSLRTDENGVVTIEGFLGEYELQSGGLKASVSLDCPGACRKIVNLKG